MAAGNLGVKVAGSNEGGFVADVRDVGSAETRSVGGHFASQRVLVQRGLQLSQVNFVDGRPARG